MSLWRFPLRGEVRVEQKDVGLPLCRKGDDGNFRFVSYKLGIGIVQVDDGTGALSAEPLKQQRLHVSVMLEVAMKVQMVP